MHSTPETKRLAKKVYKYLVKHPNNHDQNNWIDGADIDNLDETDMCGTTLCVAGAAVWLEDGIEGLKFHWENGGWLESGATFLGLSRDEAEDLFFNTNEEEALEAVKAIGSGDEKAFHDALPYFIQ